jgi:RNA 2',3'-cyclic 3'-phosphodiesterase
MRTFIAIEIPAAIKTALAALQNDLRRAAAEVSWTRPENIHLTLRFLGEITEQQSQAIAVACEETAAQFPPFTLNLDAPGFFPNTHQPRVLWAGLRGEVEAARQLQLQLEQRLLVIGLPRADKSFQPHLTIGRIKSGKNAGQLVALADLYDLPALSFTVDEIVLMKSELHPAGARYTPLSRARLQRG